MAGTVGVIGSALVAWRLAGGGASGLARLGLERPASWGRTVLAAIASAVIAAVAAGVVASVVAPLFGRPDLRGFASLRDHPIELLGWLVIAWTSAAVGEEVVFRGFLIPQLVGLATNRRVGLALGIGVSTALFGVAHLYQGPAGAIESGVVGLVFAISFVMGRRQLWRTVLAHGLFDSASLVLLYTALRHRPLT
jgi:membrane protease YdiL (CAAX protease family)